MRIWVWLSATYTLGHLLSCQYPWTRGDRSCADGAKLDMPIDLTTFVDKGTILPFGIHGEVNPEGHAGMDFILDTAYAKGEIEVRASFSAEILSITPESDYPGNSCLVLDSACIEVNLCHLHLDSNLKVGSKVRRGQRLGSVGLIKSEGKFNLHFGTYSGKDAELACPSDFLDPDTVRCILGMRQGESHPGNCNTIFDGETLLSQSHYPETLARELKLKCIDGSIQIFSLPAEIDFCAPRLSDKDRSRMYTCLGPACSGIW
jgi:hypothetical protein